MEAAAKSVQEATALYLRDLEVLTEEQILNSPGGSARAAVDFTYETAVINRRMAARLNNAEPPKMPPADGWMVAPQELRSKEAIVAYAREAFSELVEAAKGISEDEAGKLVGSPGNETPAYDLAYFASMHTMYHDAQLNYIQSLHGDLKMHWES